MQSQSRVFEKAVGFRAKIKICANLWTKKNFVDKICFLGRPRAGRPRSQRHPHSSLLQEL